jgi:hypothetical protein
MTEQFLNRPELAKGDLIFWWFGRKDLPGWKFVGIPGTRFGFSYYGVTGDEDTTTYDRLCNLVAP